MRRAPFTVTDLVTRQIDGEWWELREPLHYTCGSLEIYVPAGTRTNFGSIPAFARGFINPCGTHAAWPYVVHDRLYDTKEFTLPFTDSVLRQAQYQAREPWCKRALVYLTLRLFGWYAWHRVGEKLKRRFKFKQHQSTRR